MNGKLIVHRVGPSVTVQDLGRPGNMAYGLSCGGAADRLALVEGAVLLGQEIGLAALEMAGFGGSFTFTIDTRIALTGAPMQVTLDDQPLVWNASHSVRAGQKLNVGGVTAGVYGYLHVAGGIATQPFLGSRSCHLMAGIGAATQAGETFPLTQDTAPNFGSQKLPKPDRFTSGDVRVLPSVQTAQFAAETLRRFETTPFTRTAKGNRQGVEMGFDGEPFALDGQLTILSEPMLTGDIQMTGLGAPFVLLPECQTTGGYPRIATVLPDDLPIIAQAAAGTKIRFRFVNQDEALAAHKPLQQQANALKKQLKPLIRDPHEIADLLSYQLVSGMITGRD